MGYSVTGVMAHNIIGIPLAGSDICGFIFDTTPELCARWHVLGAFYPFSRNHNNWGSLPQEPYSFAEDIYEGSISYLDIMRMAIRTKYHMIRYYHTQLTRLHFEGGPFYKPLFFEFPNDDEAYLHQEYNVMLGDALKLSVQSNTLNQNMTDFYFPEGTWCNVLNTTMETESCVTYETGTTVSLETKAWNYHLHIREGHLVPMQDATSLNVNTTVDLQGEPVDIHILPTCDLTNCTATGEYINDDGLVLELTNN